MENYDGVGGVKWVSGLWLLIAALLQSVHLEASTQDQIVIKKVANNQILQPWNTDFSACCFFDNCIWDTKKCNKLEIK